MVTHENRNPSENMPSALIYKITRYVIRILNVLLNILMMKVLIGNNPYLNNHQNTFKHLLKNISCKLQRHKCQTYLFI